ncbi:hypothetical protein cyc_00236 [Cyclospora cayetanensis]|uniref:Uncharacterized protein n=1 Tax=Cyclospora cayetanensis TaxID=88456 RepID=A0A1D3D4N3_9EIME|nr:hypothetical protein cyc_00236 [Cyclospora cayetanensis]
MFTHILRLCLDWDKSGKVLRVGISGYFYDKPTYQRPVEAVVNALESFKLVSSSVKPQLDLMRKANGEAAKSIAKVERANRRKYKAEKLLSRKEAALKKLQKKAQTGKDPQAAHKVKAAEDQVQLAKNGLQMAEAELAREMQQTMNGAAPEAAMQVSRALEAMLLFLMGSGVDIGAVRAAIKTLEEAPYVSPLTAMGQQQHLAQLSLSSKPEGYGQQQQGMVQRSLSNKQESHAQEPQQEQPRQIYSPHGSNVADQKKRPSSLHSTSRQLTHSDPGSQLQTPRKPQSGHTTPMAPGTSSEITNEQRASPNNPFSSD